MDSLEGQVLRFIEKQQLIEAGDRLLIACSGGVDSVALVYFMKAVRKKLKIDIVVAHVDHMLRGEASALDREFVEQLCAKERLPVHSSAIPIPDIYQQNGGNLQALCRKERYRFLAQVMQRENCPKLVTAHHADDQLETMLMALTKGATVNGYQGMQAKRPFATGQLIRPFLAVTKEAIEQYVLACNGTYRTDESNAKEHYTRNRFRHRIIPLLQQENPHIATHAVQLAHNLQQDEALLMSLATAAFERIVTKKSTHTYTIDINVFQKESLALQRRIILILLNYIYNDSSTIFSYSLLTSINTLFETTNGSATIHLPNDFMMQRAYHIVTICPRQQQQGQRMQVLTMNKWHDFGHVRLFIGSENIRASGERYYFSAHAVSFPLHIRTRRKGDRIKLAQMAQYKRLSRLFIDCKVPLAKRDEWPLLVDAENEILAVLGVRVNQLFSKEPRVPDDYVLIVERVAEVF